MDWTKLAAYIGAAAWIPHIFRWVKNKTIKILRESSLYASIFKFLAFILTFFIGLFATPIQQYFLTPNEIKIEFESKKPYVIPTMTSGRDIYSEKLYNIYPFRFKIRNNPSLSARNCIVVISKYWHVGNNQQEFEEPNFEPLRIGWGPESRVDIGPGMEIFVSFLKIAEANYQLENEKGDYGLSGDPNIPQLRFSASSWPRWMSSHIAPGEHYILVTVYFDNRKPLQQKFKINWSGKWGSGYEEMLKQVVIEKIKG